MEKKGKTVPTTSPLKAASIILLPPASTKTKLTTKSTSSTKKVTTIEQQQQQLPHHILNQQQQPLYSIYNHSQHQQQQNNNHAPLQAPPSPAITIGCCAIKRNPPRPPQEIYFESRGKCCKKLLRYNGYPNKVITLVWNG